MELDRYEINRHQALLLVIDVQQRLVPAMDPAVYAGVLGSIELLLEGSRMLGLPVVATEQYPQGLGATVPELEEACREARVEKLSFGCCGTPAFLEQLHELGRSQVIVTGMEAHVCVYQTVLGLLRHGYRVHLVRDAICARRRVDFETALDNARAAGAVVTSAETVLFQLLQHSAAAEFKAISALVKARDAG